MELRSTPESWRVALLTAIGSAGALLASLWAVRALAWPGFWVLVAFASLATLVPAIGALTASVDLDERGVTIRRLGHAQFLSWTDVREVQVVERRASVPDGTEYHWLVPSARPHIVSVPRLGLHDGSVRELTALAARDEKTARANIAPLERMRAGTTNTALESR